MSWNPQWRLMAENDHGIPRGEAGEEDGSDGCLFILLKGFCVFLAGGMVYGVVSSVLSSVCG